MTRLRKAQGSSHKQSHIPRNPPKLMRINVILRKKPPNSKLRLCKDLPSHRPKSQARLCSCENLKRHPPKCHIPRNPPKWIQRQRPKSKLRRCSCLFLSAGSQVEAPQAKQKRWRPAPRIHHLAARMSRVQRRLSRNRPQRRPRVGLRLILPFIWTRLRRRQEARVPS
jgi:hypothetical protein